MKCKKIMMLAAAMLTGSMLQAQTIEKSCLQSPRWMLEQQNPLAAADLLQAPKGECEAFMAIQAAVLKGDDNVLNRISAFRQAFPASYLRNRLTLLEGDYYFLNAAYNSALKIYQDLNPNTFAPADSRELNFRSAFCYMMLGENKQARTLLDKLVNDRKLGNASKFYLGVIDYNEGNFDAAMANFAKVNRKTEPGVYAPLYESQIYFSKSDYEKAISAAKQMLAMRPVGYPECKRIIGESYYNSGQRDKGIPYLWEYCAESSSPQPSSYYILGVSEFDKGNDDAAVKLLQQAIGTHSAMEQSAYLLLGQAYRKRGELSQAMMAFENAYRVDYDKAVREVAFYNYAVALSQGAKMPFARSVNLLEDFINEYPNSQYASQAREYVVSGLLTDNDYEHALNIINRDKNPDNRLLDAKQRVLLVLGSRALSAGKVPQAKQWLEQAVKLNRDASMTAQAQLWLGDAYYRMGSFQAAADAYKAYLQSPSADKDNKAIARYDLGYAYLALQQYSQALKTFTQAAEVATTDETKADCYNRIGDCNYYLHNFKTAQQDYEKALSLNASAGDYPTFQKAMVQGLQKDYKGKIASLENLSQSYPTSSLLPSALLEKANSYIALNRNNEAIDVYEQLIEKFPGTAQGRTGYLQMANTKLTAGNRQGARADFEEVITLYPSSSEARQATENLKMMAADDGTMQALADFLKSVPGAPQLNTGEMESLAFKAAERDYATTSSTAKLKAYLDQYPAGANQAEALYYLGEDAFNAGQMAQAEKYLSQLVNDLPDAGVVESALSLLGQAQQEQKKYESALESYTTLEKRASSPELTHKARMGALRMASELGRNAQVLEIVERLQSSSAGINEDKDEILLLASNAHANTGNLAEAVKGWTELENDLSSVIGAEAAITHALTLQEKGKNKEAKALAEKIIASNTPQAYQLAQAYILYSDLLRGEGKKFEADEYLRALKNNYPGTETEIFNMINERLK